MTPPAWAKTAQRRDDYVRLVFERDPSWIDRKIRPYLEPDEDCLVWTRSTASNGYGQVALPTPIVRLPSGSAVVVRVHRVIYLADGETIPYGMSIDHLCSNRICASINHLEAVEQRTNLLRGDTLAARHAAKVRCQRGHILDEANTPPSVAARGYRDCLQCRRDTATERNRRLSEAHRAVGMRKRDFIATFGTSRATLDAITEAVANGQTRTQIIATYSRIM